MNIAEGESMQCPRCYNTVLVEKLKHPRRGLQFAKHVYGSGIGSMLSCAYSELVVADASGEVRALLAGPVAGVSPDDVLSAMETLTIEEWADIAGNSGSELNKSDSYDFVDEIMALISRAAENAKRG